jgi:NAD(P)-dependent dehydrogenase (short-subunit alcohol dehydrogenase family)
LARARFTVFGTSRRATGNVSQTGRIDVLVNNAGSGLLGGAEESSISLVQALFDVNLFGVMRVTNAVLPSNGSRRQLNPRAACVS